jgi:hypothetical protein
MSNGNLSHTMVTQVEIDNDNAVKVSVQVDAFMPGESVEISGYVAQHHGAFATFNDFKKIDTKLAETASLTVPAKPIPTSPAFQQGHDVMVFVRVAKVWVTVLGEGQAQQQVISPNVAGPGTVWGRIKGVAGPETYSDTWEGNQSGSAPGGTGQAPPDGPTGTQAS